MSLIQNHLQSLAYFIFPTLSIKNQGDRHIAYCYKCKQSKGKALTAFFNPTITKDLISGLISLEPFTPKGKHKQ